MIPEFETKKELFDYLVTNNKMLVAEKKKTIKETDSVIGKSIFAKKSNAEKAELKEDEIIVKVVLNTTKIMDSHSDVHINGLWKKTLSENKKNLLHLQEHVMRFSNVIADYENVKAYTQEIQLRELGFDSDEKTQALIFESKIKRDRNPEMFDQYKSGNVRQHSVGMHYVKIVLCINDKDYGAEFEAWEKYYPQIANKELADNKGYFWAVTEAKLVEGSAVLRGSNPITPTLTIEQNTDKQAATALEKDQPLNKITQILNHLNN